MSSGTRRRAAFLKHGRRSRISTQQHSTEASPPSPYLIPVAPSLGSHLRGHLCICCAVSIHVNTQIGACSSRASGGPSECSAGPALNGALRKKLPIQYYRVAGTFV